MKKIFLFTTLAIAFFTQTNVNAQEVTSIKTNGERFRIKTNPLSPMIAYEQNINLSLENIIRDEDKTMGLQISSGYLFGWSTFIESANLKNLKVNGFVTTGEFRVYDKNGFFLGPYIQFKTVNAGYTKATNTSSNIWINQSAKKTTYSGGFIAGYYHKIARKIGSEFYIGCGISKKKLEENGIVVDSFENYDDFNLILDNSGRLPQFIFTYKITYAL